MSLGGHVHSEDYALPEASYTITVSQVPGGLRGEWTCKTCGAKGNHPLLCTSIPDAVHFAKLNLARHHPQHRTPP
jgi:hypothetical protein